MEKNLSAHSDGFTSIFDSSNVRSERYFDLTDKSYHGGTTLSSGMLPKWDILNGNYLVKRCGLDSYGNFLTDAFNEETVYLFSQLAGIECAYYRSIEIKYFDNERMEIMQCPAVISEIFPGELIHYRILRQQFKFGSVHDELIEFTDRFNVQPKLNDLFFADYIFNQQDRHSKNIGIVENNMSPIFDSGACLFFDVMDDLLTDDLINKIPRQKTFGKKLDELLQFSLKYINPEFSFTFNENKLKRDVDSVLEQMTQKRLYSEKRIAFIRKLMKARISGIGQILAEI